MSAAEKAKVLTRVASSPLPKGKVLRELDIPKSTYYRWLRRKDHHRLEDHAGDSKPAWITDNHKGLSVSAFTVSCAERAW